MADEQQRWTGQLDLTVFFNGQKSVSRDIFFEKALKVIRPVYLNNSTIPTFYIVNVGGGYLDGDRYRMNVNVDDNAKVTLTSQGATKIYKTPNDRVEQYQTFTLKDNAYMEYVADPIIAYENSNFYQHNTFNLSSSSSLFYTDIITPGYSKEDKDFSYNYMHLVNEIYIDNELVTFDNLLLEPAKQSISDVGYMEGYSHYGSAYFIHPDVNQKLIDQIYDAVKDYLTTYDCRLSISQLPTHGLAIRILAYRTQTIEKILGTIQGFIAEHIYDRQLDFLRKY
ncbi:urease accessory protein UreD [Staphylococcus simiae]|uniref:Urease accessory protein UreD n=2 Tax=Staphylococcus simiae CCM 7213 = CCUG 51256 TaxID=911238 RepID=G5JFQ5_9STAP|nr:urease accessory protein UreD [Staphylococcus simiae]EHJ09045.1 urease accessory protein UreD [Staphylococcus simiae CCM 7213 = CCUG 51256]PNZ13541.1 urease accessory protein [Staphylococcus simiae]SNV79357.1 urease accessory protein UreD [Staphylococcus simiae]